MTKITRVFAMALIAAGLIGAPVAYAQSQADEIQPKASSMKASEAGSIRPAGCGRA